MPVRVKVTLNSAGVREVLHAPGLVADMQSRMERVAAAARGSAPVVSGEYRDSIHTVTVDHGDRMAVQVVADSDHAMAVEAATGNLARSLDAAGGS
jgi:hypothetical protein